MEIEKILEAGKIAKEVILFSRGIIKKDTPLLEIAEKIEEKIIELGGKPAFPVNLSINEIAAHYTPTSNDETKAEGLIKIDLGVHIDGWIIDTAFSIDLEDSEENKRLILASEKALEEGIKKINLEIETKEIGKVIEQTIRKENLQPIINLSGHSIEQYDLHSGIIIPNRDNNSNKKIYQGLYAIEPFTTTGKGKVIEGKPSTIYLLEQDKKPRNNKAREILEFIKEEYKTLPFCLRWLEKKFGGQVRAYLFEMEREGTIYQFNQLIEISKKPVAQSEKTVLITEKEKIILPM